MGFLEIRSNVKWLNPPDPRRAACVRARPECVVLPVAEGVAPSGKPPVRVFLGTEPGQHRAERVFVWSIERNRDPSRVYEIYLMKDLAGFDRRGWTTGFTNYRFAVPHLAGGRGRAIFNDVDEAYVGDPADLFDADMGGHGYLATSDSETSVMLIDCERMAPIWPLKSCQHELKKSILARTLAEHPGIRGDLPPEWTARDDDFRPGFSKLQHWTTLHTQPWRPVPGRFVYQPNPTGQLWFDLERSADEAGYQVFNRTRPSSLYADLAARLQDVSLARVGGQVAVSCPDERLANVAARFEAETLLDYGLAPGASDVLARWPDLPVDVRVSRYDLVAHDADPGVHDGVLCEGVLELLPDEDAPWVVADLFARASRFVYAVVRNEVGGASSGSGSNGSEPSIPRYRRELSWWIRHFEAAARSREGVHWTLVLVEHDARGRESVRVRDGGCRPGRVPTVWVLTDARSASAREATALAEALGWPFEQKRLRFGQARGAGVESLLGPPWPDVVISAGRRCAAAAQRIRKWDQGRTRLVHVGRDGGEAADLFDAVVTPGWARLWPHPDRIETLAALVPASQAPTPAAAAVESPFGDGPRPHVLLLTSDRSVASVEPQVVERMVRNVRRFAEQAGGSFHVAKSESDGRTRALVACADAVVVAGNDEWSVAQALASSTPVYVYPLAIQQERPASRVLSWIDRRAHTRPANRRGTPRPQQGLEYLCARLIERGVVRPPADPAGMHTELYLRGIALPFGAPLRQGPRPGLAEVVDVAAQVRERLGYGEHQDGAHEVRTPPSAVLAEGPPEMRQRA